MDVNCQFVPVKADFHLTIFVRGMRGTGKIQRNEHQNVKTLSVSLISYVHAHTKKSLSEK